MSSTFGAHYINGSLTEKFGNRELSTATLCFRWQTEKMADRYAAEQLINKLTPPSPFIYSHAQLLTRIPILGMVTICQVVKKYIVTCEIYIRTVSYVHEVL